jgi:hypothetical protein
MVIEKYHLREQKIPEGFQIFESHLEVRGVKYRQENAIAFAMHSGGSWLELEKDEDNKHDKNTIKVIGCNGAKRYFVGYVPRETSRLIFEGGFWGHVLPRLYKTCVGDDGFVDIFFQILGQIGRKYEYLQTEKAKGRHVSDYVDRVKQLMQQKNYQEAIELLLRLVDQTEQESSDEGCGVAPWYYEQLAVIYRKEKRYADEVDILERFEKQPKAPGVGPQKLAERLAKARLLLK